jgi:hypothetical protein
MMPAGERSRPRSFRDRPEFCDQRPEHDERDPDRYPVSVERFEIQDAKIGAQALICEEHSRQKAERNKHDFKELHDRFPLGPIQDDDPEKLAVGRLAVREPETRHAISLGGSAKAVQV